MFHFDHILIQLPDDVPEMSEDETDEEDEKSMEATAHDQDSNSLLSSNVSVPMGSDEDKSKK